MGNSLGSMATTLLSVGITYLFSQFISHYMWVNKRADGTTKHPWAPSPSSLPWIWNGLQDFQVKGSRTLTDWANECGHFFSVKLGQKRVVVLNNGPLVKQLLVDKDQCNSSKVVSGMTEMVLTDNGKTVFSAPFTLYWSRIRRSISGAVNSTLNSWFTTLFMNQSEKLVHAITQAWDQSEQQEKKGKVSGHQLRGLVDMVSLDTALIMVMEQEKADPDDMVKVLELVASLEQEQAQPWRQYSAFRIPGISLMLATRNLFFGDTSVQLRNNLLGYFMDWTRIHATEEKKQQPTLNEPPKMATFMSNIQPSKNDPEPEQLKKDEIIINLMHVTLHSYKYLSTAIFNMIQRLATLPDMQDRLRNDPSFADAFVKESLRYDPPVRVYAHASRVDQDIDIKHQNYRLDEDSELLVNLDTIHFNPDYYHDPLAFYPDRFVSAAAAGQSVSILDENPNKLQARDHLAFGVGRRLCQGSRISEEFLKTMVLHLVRSYTFLGGNTDRVHVASGIWAWTGRDESIGTTITFEKRSS